MRFVSHEKLGNSLKIGGHGTRQETQPVVLCMSVLTV